MASDGAPVIVDTLPEAEVLERLAKIGNGNAVQGFRLLCAAARVCSICCHDWGLNGRCGCAT